MSFTEKPSKRMRANAGLEFSKFDLFDFKYNLGVIKTLLPIRCSVKALTYWLFQNLGCRWFEIIGISLTMILKIN